MNTPSGYISYRNADGETVERENVAVEYDTQTDCWVFPVPRAGVRRRKYIPRERVNEVELPDDGSRSVSV